MPLEFRHSRGESLSIVAMVFAPFGIPKTPLWIYVCAALVLVAWLIRVGPELRDERGLDKILPFGRLFYAMPMAVFASEHFTITATIASLVPRWIPWHTFWAYAVGTGFMCAAFAIAARVQARLAATLLGATFLTFVLTMDLPAALTHPGNRFFWALALREFAFSGGAFALAMSTNARVSQKQAYPGHPQKRLLLPRLQIGIAALFYGVESVMHPRFVPVIPLNKLTPEWIHGRTVVTFVVGVILIAMGCCVLASRKGRSKVIYAGLAILVAICWVYLPMLIAAPLDLLALNFIFDTLLFGGAVLLLAGALEKPTSSES